MCAGVKTIEAITQTQKGRLRIYVGTMKNTNLVIESCKTKEFSLFFKNHEIMKQKT